VRPAVWVEATVLGVKQAVAVDNELCYNKLVWVVTGSRKVQACTLVLQVVYAAVFQTFVLSPLT
jgi:hypothetical protein